MVTPRFICLSEGESEVNNTVWEGEVSSNGGNADSGYSQILQCHDGFPPVTHAGHLAMTVYLLYSAPEGNTSSLTPPGLENKHTM